MFFRTYWCYSEAYNTGTKKWSSIVQYSCTSIWDLKYTFSEKAFDSVWQEGLWTAMKFFGYRDKITRLLQALYKQSQSAVRLNGDLTDWFATTVGVRQSCVLSPELFDILLELVMFYATHEICIGANIQEKQINNLRFADDIVLMTESANDLQVLVDRVQDSSCNFVLTLVYRSHFL